MDSLLGMDLATSEASTCDTSKPVVVVLLGDVNLHI